MGAKLTAAAVELHKAVRRYFASLGASAVFTETKSRPWASVTFCGERHRLTVSIPGPNGQAAVDAFLAGLAERDFILRGHVLAYIEATGIQRGTDGTVQLTVEALTVENQ